jgi:SAM-dependent methyltransferase
MSETRCRSCLSEDLDLILSLGETPLANALVAEEELGQPEEMFPLDLVLCRACSLVQITETVAPEKLFRNYLYFTSFSETMLEHAETLANGLIDELGLKRDIFVVEIASNDGYLLQHYQRAGMRVLGVEPAVNIAELARERGIPTVSEFFGVEIARALTSTEGEADVVHAHNVLAHVADLNGLVAGIALLLKVDGSAIIEVPYVKDMIDRIEFDTIYHEHLCYFSLTALDRLFRRHELLITDARRIAIHGGSLQLVVKPTSDASRLPRVEQLLAEERGWGVDSFAGYVTFSERVEELRRSLHDLLGGLKDEGKRIAAYGAAAKGSTLLNAFGIDSRTIDFVVDRSTYKQGFYMPGVRLPIYSPQRLLDEQPDFALLLTWNFADEILRQQAEYRSRGGRFIIPLPEPSIV